MLYLDVSCCLYIIYISVFNIIYVCSGRASTHVNPIANPKPTSRNLLSTPQCTQNSSWRDAPTLLSHPCSCPFSPRLLSAPSDMFNVPPNEDSVNWRKNKKRERCYLASSLELLAIVAYGRCHHILSLSPPKRNPHLSLLLCSRRLINDAEKRIFNESL